MAIFNNEPIYNYFNRVLATVKKTIETYDFRQLKEFSDREINLLVEKYRIEKVDVDFENANVEIENGIGEVFNLNSAFFENESKYVKTKGKYFKYCAIIKGDGSLLTYDLCEQGFEMINYHDENYEDITIFLCRETQEKSLLFDLFIPDSKFENKDKEDIISLVKKEKDLYLQTTKMKISYLNALIDRFNDKLPENINKFITTKINDDSSLEFISNAIGIDLKTKNNNQVIGAKIELLARKNDILLPDRKKYEGYYLDKNNYVAIISTIINHLTSTEQYPKAIEKLHDEELIRDTILWSLNANYFVATGETFRGSGKTDILISFKDKSVYVAECKIWKGKKYLEEGLEQLLSYTTWRDSKMSLIVFNLNTTDFAKVCMEAKSVLKEHKWYSKLFWMKTRIFLNVFLWIPIMRSQQLHCR